MPYIISLFKRDLISLFYCCTGFQYLNWHLIPKLALVFCSLKGHLYTARNYGEFAENFFYKNNAPRILLSKRAPLYCSQLSKQAPLVLMMRDSLTLTFRVFHAPQRRRQRGLHSGISFGGCFGSETFTRAYGGWGLCLRQVSLCV